MAKSKFPFISPLKTAGQRVIKNIRAFDIETDGLGGDFLAVGWEDQTVEGGVSFSDDWYWFLENVLLQDTDSLWTAHNLGGYESLYFFDHAVSKWIAESGWSVQTIGPKDKPCLLIFVKEIDGEKTEIKIWDSYSLARMSLADATAKFNTLHFKAKGDIDFETEIFNLNNKRHKEYLRKDVLSLSELVYAFREYVIGNYGVEPGYTLPSTGVKAWRHTLSAGSQYRNITSYAEEFIRKAYRGGRVIANDSFIHESIHKYDFNSMYPAIMRSGGVPTGPDRWSPREIPDEPGFVRVRVNIPESTPPWRCVLADENNRYPVGVFESYCTTNELAQAKEWGATVEEFIEGYYFTEIGDVFTDFVDLSESLRASAKEENNKPLELIVKLVQNSLYGKFGQKREMLSVQISEENLGLPLEVDGMPSDYVYEVPVETASNQIMPHWAAWITAESRLKLVRSIDVIGDNFVYADTDSILVDYARVTNPRINGDSGADQIHNQICNDDATTAYRLQTGSRYGELKHEGILTDFFVVAPKTYSGFVEGLHSSAAKGIPKAEATRERLESARRGESVQAEIITTRGLRASVRFGIKQMSIYRSFPCPQNSLQFEYIDGYFYSPQAGSEYTNEHVWAESIGRL